MNTLRRTALPPMVPHVPSSFRLPLCVIAVPVFSKQIQRAILRRSSRRRRGSETMFLVRFPVERTSGDQSLPDRSAPRAHFRGSPTHELVAATQPCSRTRVGLSGLAQPAAAQKPHIGRFAAVAGDMYVGCAVVRPHVDRPNDQVLQGIRFQMPFSTFGLWDRILALPPSDMNQSSIIEVIIIVPRDVTCAPQGRGLFDEARRGRPDSSEGIEITRRCGGDGHHPRGNRKHRRGVRCREEGQPANHKSHKKGKI